MEKVNFLTAGQSEEVALRFACDLVGKLYLNSLKSDHTDMINLRCFDANQAHAIDKLLWQIPENLLIPHKLINDKDSKDCNVEISYPGTRTIKNYDFLNTPIKIYEDYLIILYPEKIIFLSNANGEIIYEKIYKSSNIIQSSGGKIENYFNIIFFLLPNSEFNSLDTYLFEAHNLNFDKIEFNTSLNNLKDLIHVYKNFLVYLDNGNIFHTYDINNNKLILVDLRINNSSSAILFNNSLISKNDNFVEFYNIKNGNLFSRININKILNKKSKIINSLIINKNMHLFTDNGEIVIFDQNLEIQETVNLKIKNINKVYNYQNKIFISSEKGITYIY